MGSNPTSDKNFFILFRICLLLKFLTASKMIITEHCLCIKDICFCIYEHSKYLCTSDESEPSWLEPGLKLNDFQLGST